MIAAATAAPTIAPSTILTALDQPLADAAPGPFDALLASLTMPDPGPAAPPALPLAFALPAPRQAEATDEADGDVPAEAHSDADETSEPAAAGQAAAPAVPDPAAVAVAVPAPAEPVKGKRQEVASIDTGAAPAAGGLPFRAAPAAQADAPPAPMAGMAWRQSLATATALTPVGAEQRLPVADSAIAVPPAPAPSDTSLPAGMAFDRSRLSRSVPASTAAVSAPQPARAASAALPTSPVLAALPASPAPGVAPADATSPEPPTAPAPLAEAASDRPVTHAATATPESDQVARSVPGAAMPIADRASVDTPAVGARSIVPPLPVPLTGAATPIATPSGSSPAAAVPAIPEPATSKPAISAPAQRAEAAVAAIRPSAPIAAMRFAPIAAAPGGTLPAADTDATAATGIDLDAIFPAGGNAPLTVAFVRPPASPPAAQVAAPTAPVGLATPAVERDLKAIDAPAADASPPLAGIAAALPAQTAAATLDGSVVTGPVAPNAAGEVSLQHHLDVAHDSAWLDRLARDIASSADHESRMRFQLNPERLGALQVDIARNGEGATVRFTAETEATRALIADAQPKLVAEARAQGMTITDSRVDVSGQTGTGQTGTAQTGTGQTGMGQNGMSQSGYGQSGGGAASAFGQQQQSGGHRPPQFERPATAMTRPAPAGQAERAALAERYA